MNYNNLTPDEERVIMRKGTESPFSGEYCDHKSDGAYVCRRCDVKRPRVGAQGTVRLDFSGEPPVAKALMRKRRMSPLTCEASY